MLVQVGKRFLSEQHEIDEAFASGMKELFFKSPVFKDCHDDFIRDLIAQANRKEYAPNRYILEEGSRGDSMFVIFRGSVEVTSGSRYICKLGDGSIVGEGALLSIDNRRTATIRSLKRCDVAIIFRNTFHSILEKYPWEKRKFQREMQAKLVELGKMVDVHREVNLEQQAAQCDALKRVPFFADEDMHDFVAELTMNASSHWYRQGHVIIQEGDTRCDNMYVLLRGAVEVSTCGEFLGRLENDLFGEIAVLDLIERRTANVIAATQCHCMLLARRLVIPMLAKYPVARMRLLEHARARLVALNAALGAEVQLRSLDGDEKGRPGVALGFGGAIPIEDAQVFAASPILRNAKQELLHRLSEGMSTKTFNDGATIIQDGDSIQPERDLVYWIVRGQVEVWKFDDLVCLYGDGEVFGEFAVFGEELTQLATVKSKGKVELRAIKASALQEVLESYDDPDLMRLWHAQTKKRRAQLERRIRLRETKSIRKTKDLDFMFMKLPGMDKDGQSVPRLASLTPAVVLDMCGDKSAGSERGTRVGNIQKS
mmetsp:Transcript_126717/g.253280  ORF Transcript_126717/g.253280 Transcript_126717/m.253280 type:complete len:541 (+) Transcript_126717:49-1671(+)|eukprot:CAMPEP_0172727212 /NCGR_PEP_ID=MMETSP1074-20121228/91549_1 /TAXON_ID=2916 /ORGANISM="Ceratium fusus, Strain PA161109" /LENGTH=540 /DNA_ID=CAMNT_0013554337 /DNA_START=43 /DNA_END=1665 /DNA_ORIENTATION=+